MNRNNYRNSSLQNLLEDNLRLNIDTVEEIFNRLANGVYGTPVSRLNVPENREFAAVVLFLRKLMHQAGFHSILLKD